MSVHESRAGAAHGDDGSAAFDAFYRAEYPGAVRLARLLLRDHARAEEVAQAAFIRMLSRVGTMERSTGYLRTIVVNLCRDHHRRAARLRALPTRPERLAPPPDLPESASEVWRALWNLPQAQREVLVLRFYLDQSAAQIGEVLHLPVGTVRSHIHRGLVAMKQVISHG